MGELNSNYHFIQIDKKMKCPLVFFRAVQFSSSCCLKIVQFPASVDNNPMG